MASKASLRKRSCTDKRSYRTWQEALIVLLRMIDLHIYQCEFGKHYHIGHKRPKNRARSQKR